MITSAKFDERGNIIAVIDGKTLCVPNDMNNSERQQIAEWEKVGNVITPYTAPIVDIPKLDMDTLNAALAQDGSIVRALGLVMFDEINKLRVKNGDVAYTMPQFKTALQGKMR